MFDSVPSIMPFISVRVSPSARSPAPHTSARAVKGSPAVSAIRYFHVSAAASGGAACVFRYQGSSTGESATATAMTARLIHAIWPMAWPARSSSPAPSMRERIEVAPVERPLSTANTR